MSSAGFENQVQVHRLSSIKKNTWRKWLSNLKEFIIYFTSKIVPTQYGCVTKDAATIVYGEKDASSDFFSSPLFSCRVTKRTQCSMRKTDSLTATLTEELWEGTLCRLTNPSLSLMEVLLIFLFVFWMISFQFDVSTNDFQQSRV